jgi:flavin reductase (DIM6/NTAB) family NADH-FMN oxidoreductase RutF
LIAVCLLKTLAQLKGPQTLEDFSAAASLSPAKAHRYLVSLIREGLIEQSAIDEAAEFSILPGVAVPVPRIAEAPVALECRHHVTLEITQRSHLCIGSVAHLYARQGIIDPERLRVNLDAYKPVTRLFGNLHARLGEKFTLKLQSFAE